MWGVCVCVCVCGGVPVLRAGGRGTPSPRAPPAATRRPPSDADAADAAAGDKCWRFQPLSLCGWMWGVGWQRAGSSPVNARRLLKGRAHDRQWSFVNVLRTNKLHREVAALLMDVRFGVAVACACVCRVLCRETEEENSSKKSN